jgi:hypothetical protein
MSDPNGYRDRNYVFLLHSYINLCSWLCNHFCTLLWSMQASPFPCYELNTSSTKIIQDKSSKPSTILFHQALHMYNNFVTSEGISQGHNTPLNNYLSNLVFTLSYTWSYMLIAKHRMQLCLPFVQSNHVLFMCYNLH